MIFIPRMEANSTSRSTSAARSSSKRSFCGTGGPSKISDMLIRHVEEVLFAITDNGLRSDMLESRGKLVDIVQPVTSDFSKIFEGISQGAKTISDQMSASSKLSGEAIKMASDIVQALGNFHFASAALLAIATVLERMDKISENDRDCLDLIKAMLDLAKFIKQLTDMNLHSTQRALSEKMTEAVHVIYLGAIMCHSFLISKHIWKFLLTTKVRTELVRLGRKVDTIKIDLILQMQITFMYSLTSYNTFGQLPFSVQEGLPDRIEECKPLEIKDEDDHHGIEQRRQLELGAPVQNFLLPESGADDMEGVTNSHKTRRYKQQLDSPFHRISKLLKNITPKLGRIDFRWSKPNMDTLLDDLFGKGPHGFSYAELAAATRNFKHKIGQGGFGGVYRGVLAGTDKTVAVKRISQGSKQGRKEYLSEVTIMSKLRHGNIVKLLGWCDEKGELLLVYEFLPKGSLYEHLFKEHNCRAHLSWKRRYSIARDVASALVYLHEEWDQRVVHRDIKASNVMLDSDFTAKVGDFGLAIVLEGDQRATETTGLAGTLPYMAPECLTTGGKASPKSDVFSFGMVAFEIACGKRPFDMTIPVHNYRVGEWVWDLYGQGKILEAADEKLDGDFKAEEMERLMAVGLLCSHRDPEARPAMRQVLRFLKFEAKLPKVYDPGLFSSRLFNCKSGITGSMTLIEMQKMMQEH